MISKCEVCEREREVRVGSLQFAPMSIAFCQECLRHNAYPMWTLEYGYGDTPFNELAEWFLDLGSYTQELGYIDGNQVRRLLRA